MEAKEWIIQKCNNAFTNDYENWPGYSEAPLTKEEMLIALAECENKWPTLAFRGHNVLNQHQPTDLSDAIKALRKKDIKCSVHEQKIEDLSYLRNQ